MTEYWWSEKGWGERTLDLTCHLKDGPAKYGNSEFVLSDAASPSQYGKRRGSPHNPTLIPPSDFLCRAQSALGDCFVEVPTYMFWYQPEQEEAKGGAYARWLYNFSNANYGLSIPLPEGKSKKRVALTSFTHRAKLLAQFTDWSYEDADSMMERLTAKALGFPENQEVVANWEVGLEEEKAFVAEGIWLPLLTNPYLPVGAAEPVYRKLAEAHLRQLEARQERADLYIVADAVGFFSQNPNTPAEYLVRACAVAERIIKSDRAPQRESLQDYVHSILGHPNFPGGAGSTSKKVPHFEDSALFSIFAAGYNPGSTDLSGIAAELLSNPAREGVLRRIISHLFANGEAMKIALLLPAAGAILEELSEAMGEDAKGVPLEWLMLAAT